MSKYSKHSAKVGDRVRVTFHTEKVVDMIVSQVSPPGTYGRSFADGPVVLAHIRPGGYGTDLSWRGINSIEALDYVQKTDPAIAADAVNQLIARAKSVKHWETWGTHGDGNLDAAVLRLAEARREVLALIPTN